jgi:hypothetical protein
VRWFSVDKALELIEYKDTEKLFRLALKKIEQKGQMVESK